MLKTLLKATANHEVLQNVCGFFRCDCIVRICRSLEWREILSDEI